MPRSCGTCSKHVLILSALVAASVSVAVVMASIPIGGLHEGVRPHSAWLWVQFQYFVMVVSIANTSIVYNAVPSYPLWLALAVIAADNAVCAGMYWSARRHCHGVEVCEPMSQTLVVQVPTYFQLVFAVASGLVVVAHRRMREVCCPAKPPSLSNKLLAGARAPSPRNASVDGISVPARAAVDGERTQPLLGAATDGTEGDPESGSQTSPRGLSDVHKASDLHGSRGRAASAVSSSYRTSSRYGMRSGGGNRSSRASSVASSYRGLRDKSTSVVFGSVRTASRQPSGSLSEAPSLSTAAPSHTLGYRLSQVSRLAVQHSVLDENAMAEARHSAAGLQEPGRHAHAGGGRAFVSAPTGEARPGGAQSLLGAALARESSLNGDGAAPAFRSDDVSSVGSPWGTTHSIRERGYSVGSWPDDAEFGVEAGRFTIAMSASGELWQVLRLAAMFSTIIVVFAFGQWFAAAFTGALSSHSFKSNTMRYGYIVMFIVVTRAMKSVLKFLGFRLDRSTTHGLAFYMFGEMYGMVTYYVFDRNLFTAMSEAIVTYLVWETGSTVLQLVEVYVRTRRRYFDFTTQLVVGQTWVPDVVRNTLVMEGCTYEGWVWLLVADWIIHCICAVVSVLVFLFNVVFLRFGYNAKFYGVFANASDEEFTHVVGFCVCSAALLLLSGFVTVRVFRAIGVFDLTHPVECITSSRWFVMLMVLVLGGVNCNLLMVYVSHDTAAPS